MIMCLYMYMYVTCTYNYYMCMYMYVFLSHVLVQVIKCLVCLYVVTIVPLPLKTSNLEVWASE